MPYKDPKSPKAVEAQRAARRRHYHRNKEQYLENSRRKKAVMAEYVRDLKTSPCLDCGQRYPWYVMDFDHVTGDKVDKISAIIAHGSWPKLKTEIAKCELVCANCHRERTFSRMGTAAIPL